jgi:hypothetical protein
LGRVMGATLQRRAVFDHESEAQTDDDE